MWCTVDAVDVAPASGVLEYDAVWGWVHHASGDDWHTVRGTEVRRTDGRFTPHHTTHPNLPAIAIDLRP